MAKVKKDVYEIITAKIMELLAAFEFAHKFLDSLPSGWLGKTSGDVGALNDFYAASHKARAAIAKAEPDLVEEASKHVF